MKVYLPILLYFFISGHLFGQDNSNVVNPDNNQRIPDTGINNKIEDSMTRVDDGRVYLLNLVERNGEELPEIEIREVMIVASPRKEGRGSGGADRFYEEHTRLIYNIKKVYPYSQIIRDRMSMVNDTLMLLSSNRERKEYIQKFEESIFREFEGEVRKMTVTQGQILIKLIDRETQNTSFDIIKEYRGGFSAFFWQSIARIFGANLKSNYDPHGEDAMIEIIVRDIEAGWL